MHQIPEFAVEMLNILKNAGFDAYVVGGCVRDAILGITPTDVDITTSATPDEIRAAFPFSVLTGGKYLTVTVFHAGGKAEITTYRSETGYSDSRRPDNVSFASSLSEDLKRRDFTINTLCFDGEKVIDLLGGKADVSAGIIRCVGDPETRFTEDALRIMRAFRFSAELGFEIEPHTMSAALSCSPELQNISVERIRDELVKTAISSAPERISPLLECGALEYLNISNSPLLPKLKYLSDNAQTRLSALFYICGREAVESLKLPARIVRVIRGVFNVLDSLPPPTENSVKHAMNRFTADVFAIGAEIAVKLCGETEKYLSICRAVTESGEPYQIKDLAINGNDLINAGISAKDVGRVLNELLDAVIDSPESNTRHDLIKKIDKHIE